MIVQVVGQRHLRPEENSDSITEGYRVQLAYWAPRVAGEAWQSVALGGLSQS